MPSPLRCLAAAATVVACGLSLTACGSSPPGYVAVGMDSSGRLLAVVAICGDNQLAMLTLTDETAGAVATVKPPDVPSGSAIVLTGPITDQRAEGLFDLLDTTHTYTLGATVHKKGSSDDAGAVSTVRFKLADLAASKPLHRGSVLASSSNAAKPAQLTKDAFVSQSQQACG